MTETNKLTEQTLTITGDTYRARDQIKSEGFTWDAASKSWSRKINVDADGGIYYGEHYQGDAKSYRHHIECYAKSSRFVIGICD